MVNNAGLGFESASIKDETWDSMMRVKFHYLSNSPLHFSNSLFCLIVFLDSVYRLPFRN